MNEILSNLGFSKKLTQVVDINQPLGGIANPYFVVFTLVYLY